MSGKQFLPQRVAMVCLGVFLIGLSSSLLVYANFGTDPFTCMNLGLASRVGLSFGQWQLLFNLVLLAATFVFSRSLIGIGTVVNMTCIGFLVDFFRGVYAAFLPASPTLAVRAVIMLAALVLLSLAVALYMYPALGVSPYDSLAIILSSRLNADFKWCRIATDMVAVAIGFFTGSVVGVSTAASAFCMGPLIKAFTRCLQRAFPRSRGA